MPGIPGGSPYVIPGQAQIYPQGPPPTYDQALTHPAALVGQHVSKPFILIKLLVFRCECESYSYLYFTQNEQNYRCKIYG